MLSRVQRWFRQRGWKRRAFESDPMPMKDHASPRYRVQRLDPDSVLHEAYAGDDGMKALEAMDAYRASPLYGEFWFLDSHYPGAHRGTFLRWPS